MIAYLKCLCGQNKLLAADLKLQGYEVRVVNLNPAWRKEASGYKVKLPFTVVDGKVTPI